MKSGQIQYRTKERLKNSGTDNPSPRLFLNEAWPLSAHGSDERFHEIFTECFDILSLSPTANLMIKEAAAQGWSLSLANLEKHDFHLDVPEKLIVMHDSGLDADALMSAPYFKNALIISLVRALRDVWQEKRHGGFDQTYEPESILMLERVRAADCDVIAILCGWELRSEGHGDLWRHLIGSDEGDMAMVFSNHLQKDPSSLFNGKALAAAFRQWFTTEERANSCDHEALEYMDEILRESTDGNAFGKKRAGKICAEVLSCLPDKTAYLRGQGDDILRDPAFAGLHDPINQTHFMQVMRDSQVIYVQNVAFRDEKLAALIFPNGEMTEEIKLMKQDK